MNPVTFYGNPINLTIHRLWVGSNNISEGQHNFSPKEKRNNYDKIITLAFWNKPTEILTTMMLKNCEDDFLFKINLQKYKFTGTISASSPEKIQFSFEKMNGKIKVTFNNLISEFPLDHFNRGIKLLFE